ncbi:flagellar hook-basal body complex protein [Agrobacterium sp.]|uniref:flagellar hook-basal body complex protein n=1 Tax=Agrobacterium sp. TaxID=361 RepID=UPI0028ADF911|nr:flagellar hook-basal body complex protein [Agrobacterium sp.]
MSLFGTMKTGVSGMNAQANRLGTVGDNIANSGTTGYKRASVDFSSMVLPSSKSNYSSGGVASNIRYSIAEQGGLSYTTTNTNLAIYGTGFFVVEGSVGSSYLTRAGSFVKDGDGYLVNSAGYKLLGYPYEGDSRQSATSGFNGLSPVKLDDGTVITNPSTKGVINVNLPVEAVAVGTAIANLPPSQNSPNSGFNYHTVQVDETGRSDIYFTKLDDNSWEITAYVQYSGTPTGFPYDLAGGNVVMGTTTLTFDPVTGAIVDGDPRIYPDPTDHISSTFPICPSRVQPPVLDRPSQCR